MDIIELKNDAIFDLCMKSHCIFKRLNKYLIDDLTLLVIEYVDYADEYFNFYTMMNLELKTVKYVN